MFRLNARELLNKLKWHPEKDIDKVEVTIIHRGAPRDRKTIDGVDIGDIGSKFFEVKQHENSVRIPYHRILKIERDGETLWEELPK